MKAVSLFSGIGGFEIAMQRAGIEVVATCEIDKKARKLLNARFPLIKHYDDVKSLTGYQLKKDGFNGANGIITAGFPCQDLSVAGLRKGLAGARSGLFWEIIRIIDETNPKHIILENVPGLLSSKQGQDMGIIIEALVQRRYGVAWRVLDSKNFGVPQRRRRVFIVASFGEHKSPVRILFEPESMSRNNKSSRKESDSNTTRNHGNIENTSDANLIMHPHQSDGLRLTRNQSQTLTAKMGTGGNNIPMVLYSMHGGMINREEKNGPSGSGFKQANEASYTLTSSTYAVHGILDPQKKIIRKLTPLECERLQGFPDGWTAGQADTTRYKQLGNAVTVPVVEWIINRMVKLSMATEAIK